MVLTGHKRNAIATIMMMKTDRNIAWYLTASCLINGTNMQGEDGCGEATVYQSMSSFLCVTDAPDDAINHDTAPFVRI